MEKQNRVKTPPPNLLFSCQPLAVTCTHIGSQHSFIFFLTHFMQLTEKAYPSVNRLIDTSCLSKMTYCSSGCNYLYCGKLLCSGCGCCHGDYRVSVTFKHDCVFTPGVCSHTGSSEKVGGRSGQQLSG